MASIALGIERLGVNGRWIEEGFAGEIVLRFWSKVLSSAIRVLLGR